MFTRVVVTLLISSLFASCIQKQLLDKSAVGGSFIAERHKAKKQTDTIITGEILEVETKSIIIPAFLSINGVIHETDSGKFFFQVLPGRYRLQGGFVGKKWVLANVKLERGDSTHIRMYLIDDDRPLYDR
ncbi:MAG: hypothetical protein JNJ75_15325 [Cyclobacteriaceae bacterium]|nr:hypothetical protein [Cyclobacteriaceae bacterium]